MKLDPNLTLYTKINIQLTKNLRISSENIKFLEENKEEKFLDIDLGSDLGGGVGLTPKAQTTKPKPNKWNYMKQNFLYNKGNHQ